jgi:hypothetical protein
MPVKTGIKDEGTGMDPGSHRGDDDTGASKVMGSLFTLASDDEACKLRLLIACGRHCQEMTLPPFLLFLRLNALALNSHFRLPPLSVSYSISTFPAKQEDHFQ